MQPFDMIITNYLHLINQMSDPDKENLIEI